MFDVGFSEILLIIVLAIVVLGPEKLPELGKTVGKFLRTWQGAKNDFQLRVNEAVRGAPESAALQAESPGVPSVPAVPRPDGSRAKPNAKGEPENVS